MIVGREVVELVEALEAYAIVLCDGIHAFSRLNGVVDAFVAFFGVFLLLFQINHLARRDHIVLVALVVFCNLSIGDVDFFSDALEGVSRSGNDVVVLIIKVYGVQQHAVAGLLIGSASLGHEFVIACGLVEGVELIEFDELDELVGIAWVGGISGCLQPACPSFVVGAVELKEAAVAAILL